MLIFLFVFAPESFAARNLTIASVKNTLFGFEDAIITASASGFTDNETIYIKGAFYQEGSTNYFGYTKKDDDWIKNGESTTSQKQIKINEWDQVLTVKSDFEDSGYKGEGDYKLKVGFYYITSGGNLSSVNWSSNILDININEPDPTPTPTPEPTLTPTPTSAPTANPTPTPTKTPTPTPVPTIKISSPTPTLTPLLVSFLSTDSAAVLGESTESSDVEFSFTKSDEKTVASDKDSNNLSKILIILGFVFVTACGIVMFKKVWEKYKLKGE